MLISSSQDPLSTLLSSASAPPTTPITKGKAPALLRSLPGVKPPGSLKVSSFPPRMAILSGWDTPHECFLRECKRMNLGCIHSSTGSGLLICDESTADPREEPGLPSTSSGEPAELTKAIPQAPICLRVAHV